MKVWTLTWRRNTEDGISCTPLVKTDKSLFGVIITPTRCIMHALLLNVSFCHHLWWNGRKQTQAWVLQWYVTVYNQSSSSCKSTICNCNWFQLSSFYYYCTKTDNKEIYNVQVLIGSKHYQIQFIQRVNCTSVTDSSLYYFVYYWKWINVQKVIWSIKKVKLFISYNNMCV